MRRKKFILPVIFILLFTLTFTSAFTLAAANGQKPGVVFLSPKKNQLWTGKRKIKIELKNIEPGSVRVLELYLDGRLLKEFSAPPYVLTHQFGLQGQNRTLRVVVRGETFNILASAQRKSFRVDDSHSVEVKQVLVPVVVKDRKGNYVRGLKKEDFLLLSDNRPMEISYLSTRGTERFNMVQVIDISYSMQDKIHDVLQASENFMKQLMTGKDKGTFVFFNQRVFDHTGFTSDLQELVERLNLRSPVMGGTAIYDAIAYTLNLMNKTPGWNIIVIFSDGMDNCSYIDRFSLVKKVKKSPIVIYAIDNKLGGSNDVLREICSLSGGMLFPLTSVKKTRRVYEKIREEIPDLE